MTSLSRTNSEIRVDTRERILAAAIPLFARRGFEACTGLLLVVGDTVEIAGQPYRVREVIALRDGSECRARLARL